tara:strand:+ start:57033 stop:58091 length:1059 start_codon:yes stop_codon:yes gene_type:complete
MGLLRLQSKLSSIGIEIDEHEVRAVQLSHSNHGVVVVASAIFPRQDASGVGESALPSVEELTWIRGILGRRGFVGNTVSLMVSPTQCSAHVFDLPPASSGAPIDQLARMEIARAKKCGPNDFEFGHWSMPPKGRAGPETLAVACPKVIVNQIIDQFDQSGFEPVGVDLTELTIPRATPFVVATGNAEINAAVHIGWKSSLAVLSLGDSVIYARKIDQGALGAWEIARERFRLSVKGAQAVIDGRTVGEGEDGFARMHRSAWSQLATTLTSELDVAVGYVSHSYRMAPLGKITFSGYGHSNPVIEEQVDKVLGLQFEYAAPPALVESIGTGSNSFEKASRLAAAYGLAARFDR